MIATVFSLTVVSVVIGSFLILGDKSSQPGANIRTAEDALLGAVATRSVPNPAVATTTAA